jgi:hypothetical protein
VSLLRPDPARSRTSGTAIAIVVMLGGLLLVVGTPLRLLVGAPAIATTVGLLAIWLEPYRRARVLSFLEPVDDAQGAGFQIVQALIGSARRPLRQGLGRASRRSSTSRSAHGHDLRDRRRGARLIGSTLVIAAYARSPTPGCTSRCAARTRSGSASPRRSRRSSAARRPSTSRRCSASRR